MKQKNITFIIILAIIFLTSCHNNAPISDLNEEQDTAAQLSQQVTSTLDAEKDSTQNCVYTNPSLTFQYPKEWTFTENKGEDGTTSHFFDDNLTAAPVFTLLQGEAWRVDLNSSEQDYAALLTEQYQNLNIVELSQTKVDEQDAQKLVFTYTIQGKEHKMIRYFVISGDVSYEFSWTFPAEMTNIQEKAASMTASIQFLA